MIFFKKRKPSGLGVMGTVLSPALRRQRQEDSCEFEANLVYRVTSRTAREREVPCLGKTNIKQDTSVPSREQYDTHTYMHTNIHTYIHIYPYVYTPIDSLMRLYM